MTLWAPLLLVNSSGSEKNPLSSPAEATLCSRAPRVSAPASAAMTLRSLQDCFVLICTYSDHINKISRPRLSNSRFSLFLFYELECITWNQNYWQKKKKTCWFLPRNVKEPFQKSPDPDWSQNLFIYSSFKALSTCQVILLTDNKRKTPLQRC